MLKKIERAQQLLKKKQPFSLSTCHEPMHVEGVGLICQQRHQFDLSKKGTLYFLNHGVQTEYNKNVYFSRKNDSKWHVRACFKQNYALSSSK